MPCLGAEMPARKGKTQEGTPRLAVGFRPVIIMAVSRDRLLAERQQLELFDRRFGQHLASQIVRKETRCPELLVFLCRCSSHYSRR